MAVQGRLTWRKRQQGLVGVIFLAVALVGLIVASIAAMSRSGSSKSTAESDRMLAATIIKQTDDFALAIDRKALDGVSKGTITFNTTVKTGLFDTSTGPAYTVKHKPPARALKTGLPQDYSIGTMSVWGATYLGEYRQLHLYVTSGVCDQINILLNGKKTSKALDGNDFPDDCLPQSGFGVYSRTVARI